MATLRARGLDVELSGGGSRLTACPTKGNPCCVSTRGELAAAVAGACPPDRQLRGAFGEARSVLAGECSGGSPSCVLTGGPGDCGAGAPQGPRAGAKAVPPHRRGQPIDHEAHAGRSLRALYADFAGAVRAAVGALSARTDALVLVTGDHVTLSGTQLHADGSVPVLLYGAGVPSVAEKETTLLSQTDVRRRLLLQTPVGACAA